MGRFMDGAAGRADGRIGHYFGYTPAEHRAGARPSGAPVAEFLEYWQRKGATVAKPPVDR